MDRKVNLVSLTMPRIEGLSTAEDIMVYCARVSNPSNQLNLDTGSKLLKYCLKNSHWSVFEQANLTVEINTTRTIARQIIRHRSFCYQEFCISGDSKITTGFYNKNGKFVPNYISIEKLYERQKWRNYQNILLRVYDESTGFFTTAKLKEVFKTGKKEVFKITLRDGKTITATKEHKFLTPDGFLAMEDALNITISGNIVSMTNPKKLASNGIICYQSCDWLKQAKIESIVDGTGLIGIAKKAQVSYHTIRKWLKKFDLQFTKKEVALYSQAWNKDKTGYKLRPRTSKQRMHMRNITPRGKDHPAYKGGSRSQRQEIAAYFNTYRFDIFKKFEFICQMCKLPFNHFDGKIDLHHIKEVSLYPELAKDINNVIPVHRKCHMEHHGKTYNYQQIRKKHNGNTLIPRFQDVISIEYVGEIDTYDLEVDHPSHNYIANKIVVHNSQRYAEVKDNAIYLEARTQDNKNRQSSHPTEDPVLTKYWSMAQAEVWHIAQTHYQNALQMGIAKEQARALLPEGMTPSCLYMTGTVRSFITYLLTRLDKSTQLEHREIAKDIWLIFKNEFPHTAQALIELHGDIFEDEQSASVQNNDKKDSLA